ncbi:MAG: glycosyltransferase family 4 protein [Gammaproteobacteria bacterium]|nr:glycosyltransferase family 4 protein [Gammaproteobacteria bacterium]
MRYLNYLSLQATREGQASHAHVYEIIKGLKKRGWNISLFEPSYAGSSKMPGALKRSIEFIKVQIRMLFSWIRNKPNILYIRHHFASWPVALAARVLGIPVVQEINGPYEDLFIAWPVTRKFKSIFIWQMRSQLRWADAVIAVTEQLAEWANREGARNVYVVPNGANTELFHPDAIPDPELELPKSYVVFFGALAPWQGIETMVRSVEEHEWPLNVQLVIVGDGIERFKVEAAAARSSAIHYLGPQPYNKMPGIVANSISSMSPQNDLMGRASKTGLFPLKVFESMACGVPVIVSDYPGMADMVRECGCGLVVPPGDPKALAAAVRELYLDEKRRVEMGKKGREAVLSNYSWDKRAEETENILLSLLRGQKR